MTKESFLLVSLKEDKVKDLAQTITNDTCRKILDYLSENEGTESSIAKATNIPLSTVHYNIKQLVKAGLVVSDEYHYSEKGKEVSHYKLANKLIIIAPKSTFGFKEKLKQLLPVVFIISLASFAIHLFSKFYSTKDSTLAEIYASAESTQILRSATTTAAKKTISEPSIWSNISLWFFIGAISALIIYLEVMYIIEKIRKK